MRAYDIIGTSSQNFYKYLADGHPLIIWSTINAKPLGSCYATQNYNGKTYRTYTNSHTVVLKGYNIEKNVVYIADSISGYTTESTDWISFLYGVKGMQAVVIS